MSPFSTALLDRRYRVTHLLSERTDERHYAGWHVELALPVRIVAMRHPDGASKAANEHTVNFWDLATQASRVRHATLPRVRDCFRRGDTFFVVTGEVPGDALAERLRRGGRLSLREALGVGLQFCEALDYVSEVCASLTPLTVIAPCDIVLQSNGRAALTHLGPRRWLGIAEKGYDLRYLPFLAPEVLEGRAMDVRADMYSLGAVLYTALAGSPPPPAGPGRTPLHELEPLVPVALSRVIERAMSADPAARFASPAHFGQALGDAICSALPALVAPHTPSHAPGTEAHATRTSEREGQCVVAPRGVRTNHLVAHLPPRYWPLQWAHELSRVAGNRPLRRARERMLAARPPLLRHSD